MQEPLPFLSRGPRRCAVMVMGASGPAGVGEPGIEAIGVSQELGRSCRLHRISRPMGVAEPEHSRSTAVAFLGGGSEPQDAPCGTAKRRQRSAAGGAAGRRSALIVPLK